MSRLVIKKLRVSIIAGFISASLVVGVTPANAAISFGPSSLYIIKVSPSARAAIETAVKYQFYAALLLLILSFHPVFNQKPFTSWITLFLIGLGCFSGYIYGLVLAEITHVKLAFLGPITPIGGLLMIISEDMLGIKYSTNKSDM